MNKTAILAAAGLGTLALAGCGNPTDKLANPTQNQVNEACVVAAQTSTDSYDHPNGVEAYTAELTDSEKKDRLAALKILGNAESDEGQYVSPDIAESAAEVTDVTDPAQFTAGSTNALRSAQIDCSYGFIKYTGDLDALQ